MTPHDENAPLARLAAALNPADPHPDRVVAAADQAALEVVRTAKAHRVSVQLSRALDRGGRLAGLAEEVRQALRQDVLEASMQRAHLDRLAAAASVALSEAGIPSILLKGAALGVTAYAEPSLREMTDVDLLVRPEHVDAALAALAARGFGLPSEEDRAFWRDAYYNLPLTPPPDLAGTLEVHWSIAQETRHHPDIPGLFERSREVEGLGTTVRVLGAADLFLHQALHLSYHYFEPKLAWIMDLALLGRDALPATEVRQRARRWGMEVPLALAVLQAEKACPGAIDRELANWAAGSVRARLVVALFGSRAPVQLLAGWDRRWRQLLVAVLMLDQPLVAFRPVASWAWRAARFGDREGRRRGAPRPAS